MCPHKLTMFTAYQLNGPDMNLSVVEHKKRKMAASSSTFWPPLPAISHRRACRRWQRCHSRTTAAHLDGQRWRRARRRGLRRGSLRLLLLKAQRGGEKRRVAGRGCVRFTAGEKQRAQWYTSTLRWRFRTPGLASTDSMLVASFGPWCRSCIVKVQCNMTKHHLLLEY